VPFPYNFQPTPAKFLAWGQMAQKFSSKKLKKFENCSAGNSGNSREKNQMDWKIPVYNLTS